VTLEVHAVIVDDDLDLVDELHDVQEWIPTAAVVEADELPPDLVAYRHRWRLRPGEYDLRIMVHDPVSGRVGRQVCSSRFLEILGGELSSELRLPAGS
jgi:hypothetical protein